jgi:hypothetical protein
MTGRNMPSSSFGHAHALVDVEQPQSLTQVGLGPTERLGGQHQVQPEPKQ